MKPIRTLFVLVPLCGSLAASPGAAAKRPIGPARPPDIAKSAASADATAEAPPGAKVVQYGEKDVVRIKTKLRYTTLIVLPKNEQILDFTCGDKDFWVVNGAQNFAYVKPAKAASETNLNLVTASGNIYSFVLAEISDTTETAPDMKVFVEMKDEGMMAPANGRPRFVAAQVADEYKQQAELAKEETRQVKKSARDAIDSEVSQFITKVRFPYQFQAGKKPFYVRMMSHDEKFTYIHARPEETPTLYELLDGKPNLVNFDYQNGLYTVKKVLDRGYLAIGKQKLPFARED